MFDKAVDADPSTIKFVPESYKTQKMCDRVVSEDPFLIVYCHDKYTTQRMYDEAVDDFLAVLIFIRDWFVTSKMIKKLLTALYADDNILYFIEDSGNDIFSCIEMGILNIDFNNINLNDTNYDEDDPETIIHVRLLAWHIEFEKCKALKKKISEELMLIAWHTKRF